MDRQFAEYVQSAINSTENQLTLITNENKAVMIANSVLVDIISNGGPELSAGIEFTELENAIHPDVSEFFDSQVKMKIKLFMDEFAFSDDAQPTEYEQPKAEFTNYIYAVSAYMAAYAKLQLGFYFNDMVYIKKINSEIMEFANEIFRTKMDLSVKIMEQLQSRIVTPKEPPKKLIV